MIKVLVVDDHPVVRHGVKQILEDDVEIGFVGEASDSKEMQERISKDEYDVVLLDISLPGKNGLNLIKQIKKSRKETAILIFSIHSEDVFALAALKEGASGYVAKATPPEEVISAIKTVAKGNLFISQYLAEKLAEQAVHKTGNNFIPKLSVRESEVLDMLATGKSVSAIARELSLSSKTISTYRIRLLSKLKLSSTAALIKYAVMRSEEGSGHDQV